MCVKQWPSSSNSGKTGSLEVDREHDLTPIPHAGESRIVRHCPAAILPTVPDCSLWHKWKGCALGPNHAAVGAHRARPSHRHLESHWPRGEGDSDTMSESDKFTMGRTWAAPQPAALALPEFVPLLELQGQETCLWQQGDLGDTWLTHSSSKAALRCLRRGTCGKFRTYPLSVGDQAQSMKMWAIAANKIIYSPTGQASNT